MTRPPNRAPVVVTHTNWDRGLPVILSATTAARRTTHLREGIRGGADARA